MGILVLSVFLLTNCNKEAKQDDSAKQGEITFAPIEINPDKDFDFICEDGTVTHARVVIDGEYYYPLTFVLDGKLFTQAIKLDAGAHLLEEFSLMDNDGYPADDHANHRVLKSTPMYDSEFEEFVQWPLYREFYIEPFQKYDMWIEVLCYIPAYYDYFGFQWFQVHEIIVREQCFFGDICLKHPADYEGSLYEEGGLDIDEIAIFEIKVYRNGDLVGGGNNDQTFNNGPLCIQYADRLDMVDTFDFELWILVKVGNGFQKVLFHTWTFNDDEMLDNGGDGVVEFVLGNCNYSPTDLLLPPWMNLPCEFDYQVTQFPYGPSYFQVNFSGIGAGYDIYDGLWDAWCADLGHTIGVGPVYEMCAYSSLYPWLLPPSCQPDLDWTTKGAELNRVNWLFNNLDGLPAATSGEFQDAIWLIMGDNPANPAAVSILIASLAQAHGDYSPLPGGWAAILMYEIGGDDCTNTQITFVVVDP